MRAVSVTWLVAALAVACSAGNAGHTEPSPGAPNISPSGAPSNPNADTDVAPDDVEFDDYYQPQDQHAVDTSDEALTEPTDLEPDEQEELPAPTAVPFCELPGWQDVHLTWAELNTTLDGAGVELCVPESWKLDPTSLGAGLIQFELPTGFASLSLAYAADADRIWKQLAEYCGPYVLQRSFFEVHERAAYVSESLEPAPVPSCGGTCDPVIPENENRYAGRVHFQDTDLALHVTSYGELPQGDFTGVMTTIQIDPGSPPDPTLANDLLAGVGQVLVDCPATQ